MDIGAVAALAGDDGTSSWVHLSHVAVEGSPRGGREYKEKEKEIESESEGERKKKKTTKEKEEAEEEEEESDRNWYMHPVPCVLDQLGLLI